MMCSPRGGLITGLDGHKVVMCPRRGNRPRKCASQGPKSAVGEGSRSQFGMNFWMHLANSEDICLVVCGLGMVVPTGPPDFPSFTTLCCVHTEEGNCPHRWPGAAKWAPNTIGGELVPNGGSCALRCPLAGSLPRWVHATTFLLSILVRAVK